MLWETIDKIEMEVAQEVREILFYHTHNSQSCMIEGLDGWWHSLAWYHVVFEEDEGVNNQIFHLEPLLGSKSVVWLTHCIQALKTWQIWELLLTRHNSSTNGG